MVSSHSYADFERDYETNLSKIRSFLAQPSYSNAQGNAANISQCEKALRDAKNCVHAMQGMAEIEGDPFKLEDAKRKLEREVGPLEEEIRGRKGHHIAGGGASGVSAGGWGRFKKSNGGGGGQRGNSINDPTAEHYLFGNRKSYAPPRLNREYDDDVENGEGTLTAPLTETEERMRNSEHLLRETQALCAESEQIGAATLETMGRQREQIERSSGFLQESLQNTEQARQIMKEMAYRAFKNKIFLYCVIALLVIANGAVIIHLWRRRK